MNLKGDVSMKTKDEIKKKPNKINKIKEQICSKEAVRFQMLAKYMFSFVLTILVMKTTKEFASFFIGIGELLIIFCATNLLLQKNVKLATWFNIITLLIFNIEKLVLFFSGTFVTLVMITNLVSLHALSGKVIEYFGGAVLVIVFSCLPICSVDIKKGSVSGWLSISLSYFIVVSMIFGYSQSALYGVFDLVSQEKNHIQPKMIIRNSENVTEDFLKEEVPNFRPKDDALKNRPNVVLIFTEGLSQSIIDDDRNIMPNVRKYQKKSLTFNNYYNHTFATYRGIISQLYSGYQLDDSDANTLVSIQDVFKRHGYNTIFLNSEPKNTTFTDYLAKLEFDQLIDGEAGEEYYSSDKDMYKLMWKTVKEQGKKKTPFFVSMYTFNTHLSMDSPNKKYEDGSNALLNKFYNLDYQFGKFMKKLNKSSLADNTIVVFTADHCTYQDSDFVDTFPNIQRDHPSLDRIPLLIYYKGMNPEIHDAAGRNSLDLAPTILDYIDISSENYFMGGSLFEGNLNVNNYDTIYYDGGSCFSSDGNNIQPLSEAKENIAVPMIQKYLVAKTQHAKY